MGLQVVVLLLFFSSSPEDIVKLALASSGSFSRVGFYKIYLSFVCPFAHQVWLDMSWPGNKAVFIAFHVDTTAVYPSITLKLLSHSVKSREENQQHYPNSANPLPSSHFSVARQPFFFHYGLFLFLLFEHLKGVNASA